MTKIVDYQTLFLYPTGAALTGILLLALFFNPPTKRPVEVGNPEERAPTMDEGGAPSPP